jgi:hypothetical protein
MFFKKTDVIIIVSLIAAAAIIFCLSLIKPDAGVPGRAQIYYYSELVKSIDLHANVNETFSLPQNENVIFKVSDGYIWFEKSDCPDKICINSGKLSRPGQSAACLPNAIVLKIVPAEKDSDGLDAVVGK